MNLVVSVNNELERARTGGREGELIRRSLEVHRERSEDDKN